jgi:beta-lactamase class D
MSRVLPILLLVVSSHVGARELPDFTRDAAEVFEGVEATLIVSDASGATVAVFNPGRAALRFTPASTFKIPNSLIGLETGVITGLDFRLTRDPARDPEQPWWPASWKGEVPLPTAFGESVVWFYQEVARRVGLERMEQALDRFAYGNRDIGGGIDQFWLRGNLRISAEEQIDFLRRMHRGELGVTPRALQIVRDILKIEEGEGYVLSGKTGTGNVGGGKMIGWLVGFATVRGDLYYYALNVEGERVWEEWQRERRVEAVRRLLIRKLLDSRASAASCH